MNGEKQNNRRTLFAVAALLLLVLLIIIFSTKSETDNPDIAGGNSTKPVNTEYQIEIKTSEISFTEIEYHQSFFPFEEGKILVLGEENRIPGYFFSKTSRELTPAIDNDLKGSDITGLKMIFYHNPYLHQKRLKSMLSDRQSVDLKTLPDLTGLDLFSFIRPEIKLEVKGSSLLVGEEKTELNDMAQAVADGSIEMTVDEFVNKAAAVNKEVSSEEILKEKKIFDPDNDGKVKIYYRIKAVRYEKVNKASLSYAGSLMSARTAREAGDFEKAEIHYRYCATVNPDADELWDLANEMKTAKKEEKKTGKVEIKLEFKSPFKDPETPCYLTFKNEEGIVTLKYLTAVDKFSCTLPAAKYQVNSTVDGYSSPSFDLTVTPGGTAKRTLTFKEAVK